MSLFGTAPAGLLQQALRSWLVYRSYRRRAVADMLHNRVLVPPRALLRTRLTLSKCFQLSASSMISIHTPGGGSAEHEYNLWRIFGANDIADPGGEAHC